MEPDRRQPPPVAQVTSGAGARLRGVGSVRQMRVVPAALCAAAALAGCGTGADRSEVRTATARFFAALAAHRDAEACAQLSPALRRTLAQEHQAPSCAAAVGKVDARGAGVRDVRVYATSARLDLVRGESVFLSLMRDGWRIDAFGCRPRSSGPYECEEQS
jgi:hypothetical protein